MSNLYPLIDHEAVAESRLTTQFRESATLIAYLKALLSEANDLEQVLQDVISLRTIDDAEGAVLDIIGLLVGQSRYVPANPNTPAFGYIGAVSVGSYGDGTGLVGEPWFDYATLGGDLLIDRDYRTFIRARISRNQSTGTLDEMITFVKLISGATTVNITEGVMTFDMEVVGTIDPAIQNILTLLPEILPKPAGVKLASLTFTP